MSGVFVGLMRPADAAGLSDGCDLFAQVGPQGPLPGSGIAPKDFRANEVIWVFFSGGTEPGTSKELRLNGTLVDSSNADNGYLTFRFIADGVHVVEWSANEGTVSWTLGCAPAIDGCGRLNNTSLDGTYDITADYGDPLVFQPGDVLRWTVSGVDGFEIDLPSYSHDTIAGTTFARSGPTGNEASIGFEWFTEGFEDAKWTVSCTRSLTTACDDGATVPPGYTLVRGTAGNDNLYAGSGKQLIRGLEGNDTINDLSGDDIACGNEGNDRVNGGGGNDVLVGGAGTDTLNGGSGLDVGCDADTDTVRSSVEKACELAPTFQPYPQI